MAYEFERGEWRTTIYKMTEADRYLATTQFKTAFGVVGDPDDNLTDDDGGGE